jgi:hypothetical protein
MKLKYTYILPAIYLLFFLLEALLSEISNYPFNSSILLVDTLYAVITYIVTIINLPFYLILSLLNFFVKLAYVEPVMRLGISIAVYAVIGLSLDLLQNHTRNRTL